LKGDAGNQEDRVRFLVLRNGLRSMTGIGL
jgi:hypothetical protein